MAQRVSGTLVRLFFGRLFSLARASISQMKREGSLVLVSCRSRAVACQNGVAAYVPRAKNTEARTITTPWRWIIAKDNVRVNSVMAG